MSQTEQQRLSSCLTNYQQRIERVLETFLPKVELAPMRLHEAMRYSVLSGGKRIRPLLVYAAGEALGAKVEALDYAAAALEFLHVYSLVHDDLPAMDDDTLRRGKPTCHCAYDEATAILVGDGLQALAFQVLSQQPAMISPMQAIQMVAELAQASGSLGMVGGQAIDLAAVGHILTEAELEQMHLYKTGALIRASVVLASYVAPTCTEQQRQALCVYARNIGLAFQVRDDILDVEGSTAALGKTQGADQAAQKPTYASIVGLEGAKHKLQQLHQAAIESLSLFGRRADLLHEIAEFTVKRLH